MLLLRLQQWAREQVVSVREGTRPTHSASHVAVAVYISRRVAAPLVLTQLHVSGNITEVRRLLGVR